MVRNDIDGMSDLERTFKELGRVPQGAATASARAGASIAFRAVKKTAPVDSGELQRGIIMKRERKRLAGKAVFDIMMDPAKNDIFVKVSKDGKRSYYPASQEYGFLTVDGKYIPGYRYFRRGIDDYISEIERKMLEVTGKEVDKALAKKR